MTTETTTDQAPAEQLAERLVPREFYCLRYTADVPYDQRKHAPTVPHYDTWVDADDARLRLPNPDRFDVVVRGGASDAFEEQWCPFI